MATICLRTLLDGRQENAFSTDGIGDVCVMLKGIYSRLHAVRLGIVAREGLALALRRVGTDINHQPRLCSLSPCGFRLLAHHDQPG